MANLKSLYRLLLVTMIAIGLASCGLGGGGGPTYNPSGSSDNSSISGNTDELYVAVANGNDLISHMRTAGAFGGTCSIAANLTNQDLVCIVDVPEGEIFQKGLKLEFNNPAGMCRYTVRDTYWYYNQEIGRGPASISMRKSVDGDGNIISYDCNEGAGFVPCGSMVEVDLDQDSDTFTCKYDLRDAGKENCCLGDYTYNLQITNTSTGDVSTSSGKGSWGGDIKKCIGGPGRTNWEAYTRQGYPTGVIQYAADGLRSTYVVTAPNKSVNDFWNLTIANFYTPALHTHDGYVSATVSTLPYFIDPIDDRNGSPVVRANPAYSIECLDAAFEIQNRISVYVREWDVYTNYLTYISTSGVTAVPDLPGDEGTDCDGVDGDCNDRYDLDNFVDTWLGAPYETATPALRRLNFPEQIYD